MVPGKIAVLFDSREFKLKFNDPMIHPYTVQYTPIHPYTVPIGVITPESPGPEKKCFDQLLGARSTQKLVKIHNSGGGDSRIFCRSRIVASNVEMVAMMRILMSPWSCFENKLIERSGKILRLVFRSIFDEIGGFNSKASRWWTFWYFCSKTIFKFK